MQNDDITQKDSYYGRLGEEKPSEINDLACHAFEEHVKILCDRQIDRFFRETEKHLTDIRKDFDKKLKVAAKEAIKPTVNPKKISNDNALLKEAAAFKAATELNNKKKEKDDPNQIK